MHDEIIEQVFNNYGKKIKEYLGTANVVITFSSYVENYVHTFEKVDTNIPIKTSDGEFTFTIYQDYTSAKGENHFVTDLNLCTIKGLRLVKVVTPFTAERSYDFIVVPADKAKETLEAIAEEQRVKNFRFDETLPVIGLSFDELKRYTIDFLLDEDFRAFCTKNRIRHKQGLVFEGHPGTGKSMSLKWLKNQCLKHDIGFRVFTDMQDFEERKQEFFKEGPQIFVFEEFDAALRERKDAAFRDPNAVLSHMLNLLDGIDEINNVVTIFTTNHVETFDRAMMRPGRIDKVFTFELPTLEQRGDFLKAYIAEEEFVKSITTIIENKAKNKEHKISYALLKGICDEFHIHQFHHKAITPEELENIVSEKLLSSNKQKVQPRRIGIHDED